MKKQSTEANREPRLQAVIDYLVDNGVSEINTDILLHTNMPVLGGYRSIMNEVRDGNWDKVWDTVELYISGDMW